MFFGVAFMGALTSLPVIIPLAMLGAAGGALHGLATGDWGYSASVGAAIMALVGWVLNSAFLRSLFGDGAWPLGEAAIQFATVGVLLSILVDPFPLWAGIIAGLPIGWFGRWYGLIPVYKTRAQKDRERRYAQRYAEEQAMKRAQDEFMEDYRR